MTEKLFLTQPASICQDDYPLDWYQREFAPYAEEYQALPDREMLTTLLWMEPYLKKATQYFGDTLLLLAHYYMGGEIVKMIKYLGGTVGDSYQLALMAVNKPEKKVIVESAVHFMAESISILAHGDQAVYITNPKSGCTMEMLAKESMVRPAINQLNERYGENNILPICYMNTSGRIKAMTGAQGGAVCTSSNVKKIFLWALQQNKKVLFIPDRHMGENVAQWVGISPSRIAYWPAGQASLQFQLSQQPEAVLSQFDSAQLILFASECGVHSYYEPGMVHYWQQKGFCVLVHPECRAAVVSIADGFGSTAYLWDMVMNDRKKIGQYAIGTENHMVKNLKEAALERGIKVVNLSDIPSSAFKKRGCGCATMSRNDPPHLVAILDLLMKGRVPDLNLVKPGDIVDEFTGRRERLEAKEQQWIVTNAKRALERMVSITESAQ
jgi:quinolinate synthase